MLGFPVHIPAFPTAPLGSPRDKDAPAGRLAADVPPFGPPAASVFVGFSAVTKTAIDVCFWVD